MELGSENLCCPTSRSTASVLPLIPAFGTTEMKHILLVISTLFLMASCVVGYGPLQDHSEYVSARLADDNRTVLFSFNRFAYRAATGWRAFPDGGIPSYVPGIS